MHGMNELTIDDLLALSRVEGTIACPELVEGTIKRPRKEPTKHTLSIGLDPVETPSYLSSSPSRSSRQFLVVSVQTERRHILHPVHHVHPVSFSSFLSNPSSLLFLSVPPRLCVKSCRLVAAEGRAAPHTLGVSVRLALPWHI